MPVPRSLPLFGPLAVSPAAVPRAKVTERPSSVTPRPEPRTSRDLWLAIHLPQFMLSALGDAASNLRTTPPTGTTPPSTATGQVFPAPQAAPDPLAIVDLEHGGKVVCARDAVAAAAGVLPGMALNSALALLPQLQTVARQPQRERELLVAVAEWAGRYTPRVSLESPDAVLLEVRGSLRLFGGSRRLCECLRAELGAAGLEAQLALTPTPLASLWMARNGPSKAVRDPKDLASRLSNLPLPCTRWPQRSLDTLQTMGVRTLGECARLPRDGFARRFGPRLLDMLDRALGRKPDPRAHFVSRERFATGRDLEPEIAETTRLDAVCAPLLDELCTFLRQRRCSVQALEVRLVHRGAPSTRVRLRFAEPVGEAGRIAELLRERFARIALPEPVRTLRLRSGPLLDAREAPTELFAQDRRHSGADVPQLVERLRARLGNGAVHGLCVVPEHRPEAAWRVAEPRVGEGKEPSSQPSARSVGEGARPLWLLDAPEPCDARRLEFEEGPECIETGWWDGHDVARDYYVARNAQGARLWVFRNRREADAPGWFLHGWFA